MHDEAREWVELYAWPAPRVLEIGSRNLNGGTRDLFDPAKTFFWGIDNRDGPGVDEVAEGQTWEAPEPFDLVICTEVFEHVEDWERIVWTAARALRPGGTAIFTMATDPRPAHSGIEPTELQLGEFYCNVSPLALVREVATHFRDWRVDRIVTPGDLRVWARR